MAISDTAFFFVAKDEMPDFDEKPDIEDEPLPEGTKPIDQLFHLLEKWGGMSREKAVKYIETDNLDDLDAVVAQIIEGAT